MTISDAVEIHHVSERTIRRWVKDGRLRTFQRGNVTHLFAAEVERVAQEWRDNAGRRRARPSLVADLT